MQEHHDVANRFLFSPARPDLRGTPSPDTSHTLQALRVAFDDLKGLFAKLGNDPLRGFRPDPFDHAGPEIARNALYRGRRSRVKPSSLKLPPVVAVHDPGADRLNEFTSRQGRGVTDHGHKLPLALGLHLEDDEAVAFVVVCDALDHARECLAGLIIGPLCGAVSPHGSWPRRPIGDRRPGKSFSIRIEQTRPPTQRPACARSGGPSSVARQRGGDLAAMRKVYES